jgi:hypothetical protein
MQADSSVNGGGSGMINICRPNESKSCAACCGLYNVTDASSEALIPELRRRTRLFGDVPRKVDELSGFKEFVSDTCNLKQLDPDIHVCEFIGFLDFHEQMVGCMLHPCSSGNRGVDFRGLCHYGAMACKSFYCPAWMELPERIKDVLAYVVPDWRVYGLVVTDVGFCLSITGLIELRMGREISISELNAPILKQKLLDILLLKDKLPMASDARVRRSNYYVRKRWEATSGDDLLCYALESLSFTYDENLVTLDCKDLVMSRIVEFAELANK